MTGEIMVVCSNCGIDAGNGAFCNNCGNKIIIEQGICPNCNADVGESKFCPHCGTKIENEILKSFCPSCGEDVGESKFCPHCGTKIDDETVENHCPNCGNVLKDKSEVCPYCGHRESNNNEDSIVDDIINVDDKVSGVFARGLSKSKLIDKFHDKTASRGLKSSKKGFNDVDRKYWQKTEPVFLEVYDTIDDEFIRVIFWLERNKLGGGGGGAIGFVAAAVLTPTKEMSYEEGIQFYQNMLNKVTREVNDARQKGNFNEEEFYKVKFKESTIANSTSFIPPAVKTWFKNK